MAKRITAFVSALAIFLGIFTFSAMASEKKSLLWELGTITESSATGSWGWDHFGPMYYDDGSPACIRFIATGPFTENQRTYICLPTQEFLVEAGRDYIFEFDAWGVGGTFSVTQMIINSELSDVYVSNSFSLTLDRVSRQKYYVRFTAPHDISVKKIALRFNIKLADNNGDTIIFYLHGANFYRDYGDIFDENMGNSVKVENFNQRIDEVDQAIGAATVSHSDIIDKMQEGNEIQSNPQYVGAVDLMNEVNEGIFDAFPELISLITFTLAFGLACFLIGRKLKGG